ATPSPSLPPPGRPGRPARGAGPRGRAPRAVPPRPGRRASPRQRSRTAHSWEALRSVVGGPPPLLLLRHRHSSGQLRDDLATGVGEAEVAALEAVGQSRVIEAEQVQDRGVVVVDMHRILDDVPAQLVGPADDLAALDAAAGHPEAEGEGVVVAAVD